MSFVISSVRSVGLAAALLSISACDGGDAERSTPSTTIAAARFPTPKRLDRDNDGYLKYRDCDDSNAAVHPGATEVCNELDDDCDGDVDDEDATLDLSTATDWYDDVDEDGAGDGSVTVTACEQPAGYVEDGDDCDDGDASAYPGATEVCDGVDNDCDGSLSADETTDVDGDGSPACEDCDDDDATSYPGATEVCDGVDNDCDSSTTGTAGSCAIGSSLAFTATASGPYTLTLDALCGTNTPFSAGETYVLCGTFKYSSSSYSCSSVSSLSFTLPSVSSYSLSTSTEMSYSTTCSGTCSSSGVYEQVLDISTMGDDSTSDGTLTLKLPCSSDPTLSIAL